MAFKLNINGQSHSVDIEPETPLLWVLRDTVGLTGTKYACGIAECGACTVQVNGQAVRSCVTPASSVIGKEITTIEGLSEDSSHPVQVAWMEADVPSAATASPVRSWLPPPSSTGIPIRATPISIVR